MSSYLKILSCKHYNNNDASTVVSNGSVIGNVWDKIDTSILVELKTRSASINFTYNTVENSTSIYNGVVGDYRIQDTLFNSEISGEHTSFSGAVNLNQGITSQLQKKAPFSGFSDYADATINLKYETPTLAATATWLVGTSYLAGEYSKIGSDLYVALVDNTGQSPSGTTGFWYLVAESVLIYEIIHKWEFRPYLPESDTNGASFVQPDEFSGAKALKYIFRIALQDAIFLNDADKSTERLVATYYPTFEYSIDDFVVYDGRVWRSLADTNTGNTPTTEPTKWAIDNTLNLNVFMQSCDTGFYDEKYNGKAAKYSLVQVLSPIGVDVDNSDNVNYSIQIKNNEGDFVSGATITLHSTLEKDGADFDTSLTATANSNHYSLSIPIDGTTTANLGNVIENATATINGGDASLADITFTISAGSYTDRFAVFVTPVQNVIPSPPLDCGLNQASGGSELFNNKYVGYADGAYSVDYNMLSAPDSMIVYIMDIGSPTDRIILATTGGAVSGAASLPFNFVAANAVNGEFFIEVQGGGAGTRWYYSLNCPSGTGSLNEITSFSESNNVWVSAYGIVSVIINDLQLIGDCANFNFFFHYDDLNERDGVSQFKGFQKDPALVKFELQNTNPARTVVNELRMAIKRESGSILESYSIRTSDLDFTDKRDVTFTNNEKSDVSLTLLSGIYNGKYGFVVKKEWVQYQDVIFSLTVAGNIVKSTSTEPFIKEFDSNVFVLGGLNQTLNTTLEPIVLKYADSIEYWDVTETTQYAAPIIGETTRLKAIFKEDNLGDLETDLADLTGFIYANESGGVTDTQYIHDRADLLQTNSPFVPIAPSTGALIEIDGGDPTIVTIKTDFDASKSSDLFDGCINIGARLDRTDPNPPPTETALYSLHFAGSYEGNNQTIQLSEKAVNLQVHNILNMASIYTMKYKDTHGVVDWSLETPMNIVQIQDAINSGSDTYSLHFEITSYNTSYLNAVLCLEYISIGTAGTISYQSSNILAQNVWIGLPTGYEITIDSITSGNASASIFHFGLKSLSSDDMTLYDETLGSLNALLSGNTSEKLITLFIEYQGVNINDTIDIETTII